MLYNLVLKGLIVLFIFQSCKKQINNSDSNKLLAQVKDQKLYYSDISTVFYSISGDSKDSLKVLYSLAEKWCQEMAFLEGAKKELGKQAEIESLVEKYRNSLYMDHFERKILKEKEDSSITDAELLKYYNEKRGEYKLEGPIIKLQYVKISKKDLDEKIFKPLWEGTSPEQAKLLQKYCADHAIDQILQSEKWFKWNEIKSTFPSILSDVNKLSKGMQQTYKVKDLLFYIKVIDLVKPNQEPPLSYVKEQASKSILHTRRNKTLEDRKKKLFEDALKSKEINIFIK